MKFATMVATLSALVFSAIFLWPQSGQGTGMAVRGSAAATDLMRCTVTRVHDGDGPIWCAEGPKIRLTAIAARELDESCSPGHPCPDATGAAAQRALEVLALGHVLKCEPTGTSYGRVTAWCWREDGLQLNCAMVERGFALRWDKFDRQRRMCTGRQHE